jgi:hypothetical protein
MGKDHYAILKKALKNAGHFFLRADRSLYIISTKGKIAPSRPFSHSFSIMAEVRPRVALKLLLQTGISESDFGEALEAFCDILNDIQHGNLMMAKIKGFDGNWPQRGIVLTAFNLEEKALEIVDPSSSAHRRKV